MSAMASAVHLPDAFPRGGSAIVAATTFGIGEAPGYSSFDLAARASLKALEQVNLRPRDVDGLFIAVMDEALAGLSFAEYLGIRSRFNDNCRTGGSSSQIQAAIAALALTTGQCDVALIAFGSNQRSASGKLVSSSRPSPWETLRRNSTRVPTLPARAVKQLQLSSIRYS